VKRRRTDIRSLWQRHCNNERVLTSKCGLITKHRLTTKCGLTTRLCGWYTHCSLSLWNYFDRRGKGLRRARSRLYFLCHHLYDSLNSALLRVRHECSYAQLVYVISAKIRCGIVGLLPSWRRGCNISKGYYNSVANMGGKIFRSLVLGKTISAQRRRENSTRDYNHICPKFLNDEFSVPGYPIEVLFRTSTRAIKRLSIILNRLTTLPRYNYNSGPGT